MSTTYDNYIGTAILRRLQRASFIGPVQLRIVPVLLDHGSQILRRDVLVRRSHTLQDVVHILGDAKDICSGLGDCLM